MGFVETLFGIVIIQTLVILFLVYRGILLIREMRRVNFARTEYKELTDTRMNTLLKNMRSIDERGIFEADDEVGAIFADLKNAIEEANLHSLPDGN